MKRILAATIFIIVSGCSFGVCDEYIIDAMSKEKLQLDITIRFNEIPPSLAVEIMDHLIEMYGDNGQKQKACKLEFELDEPSMLYYLPSDYVVMEWSETPDVVGPCYYTESAAKQKCHDGYINTDSNPRYCCK